MKPPCPRVPHSGGTSPVQGACLGFLFLLSFLIDPAPITAQSLRSFTITADNDGFVFWDSPDQRTDWYYTHGLRFEAVLPWAGPGARLLAGGDPVVCAVGTPSEPCVLSRITLGQSIYTPAELFSNSPPVEDRPYAGWLFFDATTSSLNRHSATSLGLQIGATGGPSLASPIHRWFHRSLGKHEPLGWDHQIPFELAFAIRFERRRPWSMGPEDRSGSVHLEPHGSLSLGTLRTAGLGGLDLRLGWNAPPWMDWWGPSGKAYILLAVGAEGELVLRDLFVDGSTWGPSAHAELEPLVGRITARAQLGVGGWGLEFAAARSTVQFTGQRGNHTVGTIRFVIRP